MSLVDLVHQVKGTLRRERGGTLNARGYGSAVVEARLNRDGAAMPEGTIVRRAGSGRVETDDTEDSAEVIGVIVGYWPDDGSPFVAGECPEDGMCAVMTKGRCRVLAGASISSGDFLFVSSTAGAAKGDGTVAAGAFGLADAPGDVGELMYAWLLGAPVFAAGSTSPLTTKGDLWGYDTDDARVPVGADGTWLMADSGDAQGVAWAMPRHAILVTLYAPTGSQQFDIPEIPWSGELVSWRLIGDASGSIVIDLWLEDYANAPATVADSMVGGGTKPNLSSQVTNEDASISGWTTTTIVAGDTIRGNVDSTSGLTRATLALVVEGS